jgi:hypothetical protein
MSFKTYCLRKSSIAILIGSLLLGACLQPAVAAKTVKSAGPKVGQPFDLKIDQQVVLSRTPLQLKLTNVEDSRCPRNVACVWEGNAAVTVSVSYRGRDNQTVTLNTHKSPTMPTELIYHGYKFSLVAVNPYPGATGLPNKVEKVVTLKVTRREN